MRARGHEQGLAGGNRHEADGTFRSMCGCGVTLLFRFCEVAQSLMCLFIEGIKALLPPAIALDPDLDTSEDHLLAAAEVDAQLDDVAVFYSERLGLDVGLAQPDVVEEGAGGALDVLDVPAAVFAPQLAVLATDDLALEANGGGGGHVCGYLRDIVALRVASHPDYGSLVGQRAGNGRELEGWATGAGILVGDETNGGEVLLRRRAVGSMVARAVVVGGARRGGRRRA